MRALTLPQLPRRKRDGHKGDFGKVDVIAGSVGYTGAPCLAAAGALRAGAGLVFVGLPGEVYPLLASKFLCAMPYPLGAGPYFGPEALEPAAAHCADKDAVVLGPGLGRDPFTGEFARRLLVRVPCPVVLDADGLNALAGHIDSLDRRMGRVTVLTPHMGEFARLLGRDVADRESEAAAFAQAHGCWLVLKGQGSIVAGPEGTCYVNPTGNPGMAAGGAGDVLSGVIAAFLAQGFGPENACCWGVYLHGLAGDLAAQALGEYAMTAADIVRHLPMALRAAGG